MTKTEKEETVSKIAPAKDAKDSKETEKSKEPKDPDTLTFEDIRENVKFIERGIASKESRHLIRVMRTLCKLRKRLNDAVLKKLINYYYITPSVQSDKEYLLTFIDIQAMSSATAAIHAAVKDAMETDEVKTTPTSAAPVVKKEKDTPTSAGTTSAGKLKLPSVSLPEVDLYLHLLVLLYALDKNKLKQAMELSEKTMDKCQAQNRRSLDVIAAKCYFYYARIHELTKDANPATMRPFLHARLRTAILRSDFEGTAVLINLLLRSYLQHKLYDQAQKLISKSTFPEQASNNEWARHFFYLGRIKAIQLEYTESGKNLTQALRKAPQHVAAGFKQIVQKFSIVVELLLGEIPDKAIFRDPAFRKPLVPYFQLTQAVRTGDLAKFNQTVEQFSDLFIRENTWSLIIRLRHNVIKTGVKVMSLSYSKISLDAMARKLQLDSAVDAEFIVAKAIRDGVIEATIDHEGGFVQTRDITDVYSTLEPMKAFDQRIKFCLDLRNQSVKAMRFPPKKYSEELETAEERRAREEEELEYAKEMADEEEDSFP